MYCQGLSITYKGCISSSQEVNQHVMGIEADKQRQMSSSSAHDGADPLCQLIYKHQHVDRSTPRLSQKHYPALWHMTYIIDENSKYFTMLLTQHTTNSLIICLTTNSSMAAKHNASNIFQFITSSCMQHLTGYSALYT
jgi:hypothetical protein